jgi:hypothetical protein
VCRPPFCSQTYFVTGGQALAIGSIPDNPCTVDEVAAAANELRGHLDAALAPHGLTRANVEAIARWWDGRVYRLLDAHERLLARGTGRP